MKLSKTQQANLDSQYFKVKGITFRIVATYRNTNDSWSCRIKNTSLTGFEAYKEIGYNTLMDIIKKNETN